jgi:hypothetical protein
VAPTLAFVAAFAMPGMFLKDTLTSMMDPAGAVITKALLVLVVGCQLPAKVLRLGTPVTNAGENPREVSIWIWPLPVVDPPPDIGYSTSTVEGVPRGATPQILTRFILSMLKS